MSGIVLMADNCPRPSIQYEAAMTWSLSIFLLVFAAGVIAGYSLRSEVAILRRERARRKF